MNHASFLSLIFKRFPGDVNGKCRIKLRSFREMTTPSSLLDDRGVQFPFGTFGEYTVCRIDERGKPEARGTRFIKAIVTAAVMAAAAAAYLKRDERMLKISRL